MVAHQFLGRSICCEVSFDQVGATCQVGGRHGGAGLGAGLTRHQALLPHEPAHRLWTGCNTIAFQDFVDPSITGGFVRSSREEDTSQKLASSSTALCGMSDMPCCARV